MSPTTAALSDLHLSAHAHVRGGRTASIADLVAGGASDRVLADTATRTADRLREAGATFGARRLNIVLSALPQVAQRAVLTRFDPHRPAVARMRRAELLFLLGHIAEGGALYPDPAADTHADQLADVRAMLAGICIPA